jgi:hypothetical protein
MRVLAAIALLGALALLVSRGGEQSAPEQRPAETVTPQPPRVGAKTLDGQDRVSRTQRRVEARVFDARPLLSRLPLTRGGVRIDIAGLAPDDRTTILAIDPGRRTRAHARAVVEALQRRIGDRHDYRLEWAR